MPIQHILEECIAIQRQIREPDLDLESMVRHAESLLRYARLCHEGATLGTTSDKDRGKIRRSFLRDITSAEATKR